ncbi:MAG: trypsin-like peptidase domain-containing protein, partial [Anaerolineae bacterium]|nr:trypsin-like peptidase domain-containing protein [Anaerolineae bacterium]
MKNLRISIIIMALLAIVSLSGCGAASSYIASTIVDAVVAPQNEVRGEVETVSTAQFSQGEVLADLELALSDIYAEVNPSVVSIQVVQRITVPDISQLPGMFFNMPNTQVPQEQYQQGAGSGFVWSKEGYIVTNHHVVAGAEKIEVQFSAGDVVTAEFIGSDPDSDLAVLKVDVPERDLYPVTLAKSDNVAEGQLAVAIGNPFGLDNTMTVGFISAINRSLPVDSEEGTSYSIPNIIQTDAPINPGNSGGVLVNRRGEVVGVTTAIISPVEASVGIGFAIPSDIVANVIPSLIENGTYEHAWLGISGMSLTLDIAEEMGLAAAQRGALVIDVVPGGPSDAAGIEGST